MTDSEKIAQVFADADFAMCLPCIAERSGLPLESVVATVKMMQATLRFASGVYPCAGCGITALVFRLG